MTPLRQLPLFFAVRQPGRVYIPSLLTLLALPCAAALAAVACLAIACPRLQDGVYPEKVNAGRSGDNTNMRRIGQNQEPVAIKFSGKVRMSALEVYLYVGAYQQPVAESVGCAAVAPVQRWKGSLRACWMWQGLNRLRLGWRSFMDRVCLRVLCRLAAAGCCKVAWPASICQTGVHHSTAGYI